MNKKQLAHFLVQRYPKKINVLSECEHASKKIRHHPDYNNPYDVILLCRSCHWRAHHQINPTSNFSYKKISLPLYLKNKIGAKAMFELHKGFRIPVVIDNARRAYGRTEYQIRPVYGAGEKWVSSDRIFGINS